MCLGAKEIYNGKGRKAIGRLHDQIEEQTMTEMKLFGHGFMNTAMAWQLTTVGGQQESEQPMLPLQPTKPTVLALLHTAGHIIWPILLQIFHTASLPTSHKQTRSL